MVKAKKGRKGGKDDEMDEDIEFEATITKTNSGVPKEGKGKGKKSKDAGENNSIPSKQSKKKDKKSKKNQGDSEDDDEDETVHKTKNKDSEEDCEDVSDNEEVVEKKKPTKKKDKKKIVDDDEDEVLRKKVEVLEITKGKKKKDKIKKQVESDEEESVPKKSNQEGGFALLAMDDEDSDADVDVPSPARSESPVEVIEKPKEKGNKKSKKSRKKRDDDDDEDLDKVLAELELEYSGQKPKEVDSKKGEVEEEKVKSKKKKKDKSVVENVAEVAAEDKEVEAEHEEGSKSKGQKKKEKRARKDAKKDNENPSEIVETAETVSKDVDGGRPNEDGEDDKKTSKKDKKKKGKEKDDKTGKGPGKKMIAAMQETLKKLKEEEERMRILEEEKQKKAEEDENARLEALRLEKERKEKKKLKEKERKERLKAEGKLLTAKQKADKARAQAMIDALKAQGLELPDPGEKKPRPGTRVRPGKTKTQISQDSNESREVKIDEQPDQQEEKVTEQQVQVEIVDTRQEVEEEDVKDAWDADSSGGDDEEEQSEKTGGGVKKNESSEGESDSNDEDDDDDDDDDEDEDDEDESSEEESESEDEHKTEAEKRRERAMIRMQKRREEAEKKRSLDLLRAAVVCVLGHVDTGKTKILDKLRRTNVQDGEAGGITQQIGATNVPIENIKENCKLVKGFLETELKIPGLLIIDTPGHESFSNLRSRGSSLCDIAILVVDIMHGLEPQTIESINLLKARKTPFIVALNKIDRLYNWQSMGKKDIRDILSAQAENTQLEFKQRTNEVIVQFAEQGLNAALFFESPDIRSYVSLVPTSAITGEGMGNLLALIVEFSQTMLAKRLMYSEVLQATVLEVKAISGLGTTIDVILINGKLAEGDTMIVAGTEAPIVTQIRSLLMPQPMKELRVKNAYVEYKEIQAAQGVKIAAKDLEKAIAGLNLQVAEKPDEVDILCEEVSRELKSALSNIKLKERGVYVQASTLGSLEALLEFLRTSKIPYSGIRIGPVVKKDVMKASIMLEHESQYATILAFDVKIERDAQELADSLGVKIFQADIIYHLFDKFMAYREELKQKKREEFKNIAVFPCKLKVLPHYVFNSRDPIVMGVIVEAGVVREGTPICVPSKEFLDLGVVTSVEVNHKPVEAARKGMEVCIKIENVPGETPKMFGRHFDDKDMLTSKISRQSIDACKDYFRDDLSKQDWQLMVELKKIFQIL